MINTKDLNPKTSLGVSRLECGSSDERHDKFQRALHSQSKVEELVDDIESKKFDRLNRKIKLDKKVECCRTCKNTKNCSYKRQFTSKGYASVGEDFKEFTCKNYKSREYITSDKNIRSLVKSFRGQFSQIKVIKDE